MFEVVGVVGGIIVFFIILSLYFMPFFIALKRRHNNTAPILLVNLFFGLTFLGWIGALIWAFTDNVQRRQVL